MEAGARSWSRGRTPKRHAAQVRRPRRARRRHRDDGSKAFGGRGVERAGAAHRVACHVETLRVELQARAGREQVVDEPADLVAVPAVRRLRGDCHKLIPQHRQRRAVLQFDRWRAGSAFADEPSNVGAALASAVQVQ